MTKQESIKELKRRMYIAGHNQKTLSESIGVTITTVNRIMNGIGLPGVKTAKLIARELGMNEQELCAILYNMQRAS